MKLRCIENKWIAQQSTKLQGIAVGGGSNGIDDGDLKRRMAQPQKLARRRNGSGGGGGERSAGHFAVVGGGGVGDDGRRERTLMGKQREPARG